MAPPCQGYACTRCPTFSAASGYLSHHEENLLSIVPLLKVAIPPMMMSTKKLSVSTRKYCGSRCTGED